MGLFGAVVCRKSVLFSLSDSIVVLERGREGGLVYRGVVEREVGCRHSHLS